MPLIIRIQPRKSGRRLSVGDARRAEAGHDGERKARLKQLYGSEPEISWFDTPVVVDNQAGGTITKAAERARAIGARGTGTWSATQVMRVLARC
jgi:hypothetical protein